jgi:neutral ceramidase
MMSRIDSVHFIENTITNDGQFSVGFAKVNLTPPFKTATAGYGNRKGQPFTFVRDSIYVRTVVLTAGSEKVAVVSADLLIMPPSVVQKLEPMLNTIGFSLENTFLSATHTHNSIGNWGFGITRFLYGAYEDDVVNHIADCIVKSIAIAENNKRLSKIFTKTVPIPDAVKNRLIEGGQEDSLFRAIEIHRDDSSKLVVMNYTAHATCLYSRDLKLSRDYPGELVDRFEERGFDFAMFMAGAVGSHKCSVPEFGEACIGWMADHVLDKYQSNSSDLKDVRSSTLRMRRIPLLLPDPQVKISEGWKIRSWAFEAAVGESSAYITSLQIGDLLLLGAPCDYSGEFSSQLDETAHEAGVTVFVSSFNGGYIGYITPAKYYDVNHFETRFMNWYPPGTGEYLTLCFEKLISKAGNSY